MTRIFLIFAVLSGFSPAFAADTASPAPEDAQALYAAGVALFDAGRFEDSVRKLQAAVELAPDNSVYHNALGRAYGRTAQHVNWFSAVSLAVKTRKEFETAVRLDPDNVDALEDLMQYYRQAPAILGGSTEKADAIERTLENRVAEQTTSGAGQNEQPGMVSSGQGQRILH